MAELTPQEVIYQKEHIHDNRRMDVLGAALATAIVATAAVTLRFICRRQMKVGISYDDYLIIVALAPALGQCFLEGYSIDTGNGRHLLAVGLAATQKFLKLEYAFEYLWALSISAVKLSVLFFYRRLFPRENTSRHWRICHYTLCGASICFGVISLFGGAFQCAPVAYLWDKAIPGGTCIDFIAFARFTSIFNIVTDILILALPIPIVWQLHLERSKKIGVIGLFLLGGFVCVASITRFCYLEEILATDPTWTNVNPGIWSTIEPCIGIVSACLPIVGPLITTKILSLGSSTFRSRSKRSGKISNSYSTDSSNGPRSFRPTHDSLSALTHNVHSRNDEEMGSSFATSNGTKDDIAMYVYEDN